MSARSKGAVVIRVLETLPAVTDWRMCPNPLLRRQQNPRPLDKLPYPRSTLASGMRENEADSWELVNNWLLDLRRRKIAVVIVHHAGRSGEMRGTSKREDNVFWIIALDDAKKDADDKRGARFVSHFHKPSRNSQEDIPAVEWHFVTESSGEVTISHKQAHTLDI